MLPHSCYKKPPSNSEGAEVDAAAVTETALYLDFEIFFLLLQVYQLLVIISTENIW